LHKKRGDILSLPLSYTSGYGQAELRGLLIRPLTTTERNWFYGLLIVIGSGILFWTIHVFEKYVVHIQPGQGLVDSATEASTRFLVQSHFIVAFLFIFTSKRMRPMVSKVHFCSLLGLGILLCWGFFSMGAMRSPLGVIVFYSYFMVHDFRDQIFFYHANGDVSRIDKPEALTKDLLLIPGFIFAVFAVTFLLAVSFKIGNGRRWAAVLENLPSPLHWTIVVLPVIGVIVLALGIKRHYDHQHPDGVRGFLGTHRPMIAVFAGIYMVLVGGLIITGRANAIINLHVTTWYVFSLYHLAKRPASAPLAQSFSWRWMRTTPVGFNFLHLGTAILLILIGAVWAYSFHNDPRLSLWFLVSRDVVPYWAIIHVTTSFLPR
jgi:hypothetical protein